MSTANVIKVIATTFLAFYCWRWWRRRSSAKISQDEINRPLLDREITRFRQWSELFDEIRAEAFPDIDALTLQALFEKYQFSFSKIHEFAFDPPVAVVDELILREFQGFSVERVRTLLAMYKNVGPVIPDGRVYVDILKASGRNLDRIPHLVKQASADFRDIVMIAETPTLVPALLVLASSSLQNAEGRLRKTANADLRQFVAWLLDTNLPPTAAPTS
jgi:hypothetical protein